MEHTHELVIDLTDSSSQAFHLSIAQFLSSAIPDFVLAKRKEYFGSVKLKCNLNLSRLQLHDINNNSKPKELHGAVIKVHNVNKRFIQRHSARNKSHRDALNSGTASTSFARSRMSSHSSSPNSSPSVASYSSSGGGGGGVPMATMTRPTRKTKNRTFVSNNELVPPEACADRDSSKQPLQSCLPSPLVKITAASAKHGNNGNSNNSNNGSNGSVISNKNNPFLTLYLGSASTPAVNHDHGNEDDSLGTSHSNEALPNYEEVIAAETNQTMEKRPPSPSYPMHANGNYDLLTTSEREWKAQHDQFHASYQRLPDSELEEENEGNHVAVAAMFQEPEEELKEAAMATGGDVAPAYTGDEDFAIALRMQQQLDTRTHLEDDVQLAMRLQREEDARAKRERESRAPRFRNPNFHDWGSHPSDHLAQLRRLSERHWRTLHAQQVDGGRAGDDLHGHDEDVDVDPGAVASLHQAMSHDIAMIMNINEDGAPFHIHRFGHADNDDVDDMPREWRRLPVRTLTPNDIQHLQKSDEKRACHICLRDFAVDESTRQLPCFHEFHKGCIDQWFEKQNAGHNVASCPLDRKEIKNLD